MTTKRKATTKRAPAWTKSINPNAFASLDGARGTEEVMIHVYWSALGDARDVREGGHGHRMQRDKVTASLGLDKAPDPGLTPRVGSHSAHPIKTMATNTTR